MVDETDADLVDKVRRGSREAVGHLAERYLRACRAVALGIVGEVAGAEDVCQEAFVYAIERIDECRQPERFGGWLLTIVRSRSRNRVRDERADRMLALEDIPLVSRDSSPEQEAVRSEVRERILAGLALLTEERRMVLLLHDLEGWTHREIAERLDLPEGTVRSHLHHARTRLRPLLEDLREAEG